MLKRRSRSKFTRVFILLLLADLFSPRPAEPAELKQETVQAFVGYVAAAERRMHLDLRNGPFLYVDGLPAEQRNEAYRQLREGQILLRQEDTKDRGDPVKVPRGLIFDWSGVLFIPGVTLSQVFAVVQNYNDYHNIYSNVRESRLMSRNGNTARIFLQLYKKSLVTVVFNAHFKTHSEQLGMNRAAIASHSTCIAEVEDVDMPDARELPVNDGHGYLWRLNSYWRFEQKDGGVYVQVESIALSRSIPAIIAWLVNPLLESIPRGTLATLLSETRTAVLKAAEVKSLDLKTGKIPQTVAAR